MVHNGLDFPPKRRLPNKTQAELRESKVRRRLSRILKEVKTECGDSNASSDDDGQSVVTAGNILFACLTGFRPKFKGIWNLSKQFCKVDHTFLFPCCS